MSSERKSGIYEFSMQEEPRIPNAKTCLHCARIHGILGACEAVVTTTERRTA